MQVDSQTQPILHTLALPSMPASPRGLATGEHAESSRTHCSIGKSELPMCFQTMLAQMFGDYPLESRRGQGPEPGWSCAWPHIACSNDRQSKALRHSRGMQDLSHPCIGLRQHRNSCSFDVARFFVFLLFGKAPGMLSARLGNLASQPPEESSRDSWPRQARSTRPLRSSSGPWSAYN